MADKKIILHPIVNGQQDTTTNLYPKTTANQVSGLNDTILNFVSGKQDTLVSGTNIKTINNNSILGGGNLSITDTKPNYLVHYTNNFKNTSESTIYRYQILVFNGTGMSAFTSTSNSTATSKTQLAAKYYPNSPIFYYGGTSDVSTSGTISASYLYQSYYNINLRYSFNLGTSTLTTYSPVYIKMSINTDGSLSPVYSATSGGHPLVQSLPSSEDGYVYVYLGNTESTSYYLTLEPVHPCFWYKDSKVVPYASASSGGGGGGSGITELSSQYIRITDLASGVYKLTYNGTKYLYYNGTSSTSTHTVTGSSGAVILNVNKYSTTYWHWYYINGSSSYATLYFGYTSTSSGSSSSKSLSSLYTGTPSNYYPIRSYTSGLQISSYSGSSNCQLYVPYCTNSQYGVVKPAYNTTGTATLTTAAGAYSNSPTINARTTTAGKYYAVEKDSAGRLYVNVPWEGSSGAASGVTYLTTAPSSNNPDNDLKFVVLSSEPTTKYSGYLYIITQ